MRFLAKVYDDGAMFAVETTDDGSAIVQPLAGNREVGKRLSAFVEVLGDDTAEGASRIQEALKFLGNAVSKRNQELQQKPGK
jgi:hypothetical protein